MFEAHVFVADRIPSAQEVHCLVTHVTDKVDVPLKLERNGRVLTLYLPEGRFAGTSVTLETNAFSSRERRKIEPWLAKVGDVASLSTRICYTVHERNAVGKCRKRSPFDVFGRLHRGYRSHFLEYLERRTGLAELRGGGAELGIIVPGPPTPAERSHKVWFNGVAELKLRARVADPATFGRLVGESIGNRRSYGFGAVSLNGLETDAEWEPGAMLEALALD